MFFPPFEYLDRNGRPRTRLIFDPNLIEARRTALKAYQGGRREAYMMGFVKGPVYCYDFSKQYTVAALSIPLPSQSSKFERITNLQDCQEMVGWARISFDFPDNVSPCIGVKDPRFPKLTFPLKGDCWTGVFSIRRALEKGARIQVLEGWGFRPTEKEMDHPIHAFFRELLEVGKQYNGEFLEKFAKSLANTLVGRLIGKHDIERKDHDEKVEDRLASRWRPSAKQVMGSFAPTIACLILDQARALEDRLIGLSKNPIYSHTDSVFSKNPIDLNHPFIEKIREFGGDVNLELQAPYAWILRSAVGYFPSPDPNGKPKAPHHAFNCRREDFAKVVETMLQHPELRPDGFAEVRYTSLREHMQRKELLASYKIRGTRPKLEWDYKRKLNGDPLKGRDLWTRHVETESWKSIDELLEHYKVANEPLAKRFGRLKGNRGRPSTIIGEDQAELLKLQHKGLKPKDIMKEFPE